MERAELISLAGKMPGVSHALRWLANRYQEGSVVTIGCGEAKGRKWRRSHRYVNGYWLGQYELGVQKMIASVLKNGDGFFDIGANAGFFSLVATQMIGKSGWSVSFDPDPDNCESIRAQIELNQIQNWKFEQVAIAEKSGKLDFLRPTGGSSTSHFLKNGETGPSFQVDVITVDQACEKFGRPAFIKMDIEGAEVRALQGATETLKKLRPIWMIEHHGSDLAAEMRRILDNSRYSFFSIDGNPVSSGLELPAHFVARPR